MHDVAICGYGPTGMLAAILLGRAGHRVAVIERYRTLYNLPRVGIVHDDVLRMFQQIGISDRIAPATCFLPTYELGFHGEVLLSNRVADREAHGWPEMTSIYQPAFEAELDAVAQSLPTVDVLQGWTLNGTAQRTDAIELSIEDDTGDERRIEARYLIGSDGGNSFVRRALGIDYENLGFDQDWLVIDARLRRPRPDLPFLRQFCEPEQPGMTMQMGPHHRRWSFMIFEGETVEEATKPESVWRRLRRPEGGTAEDFELVRVAAYKFRSLYAERWRKGHAFLAGDAAHQMPPFLAQGLCSGFRDAHNLAWKLDLVLRGLADDAFLDTYEAERGPNARDTIVESMRVGLNVNERDPEKIRLRNDQLRALQAANAGQMQEKKLIAFRVPPLAGGLIAGAPGGRIFPQARIASNGREAPFDDIAGSGFAIVARNGDPEAALPRELRTFWAQIGGRTVGFGPAGAADTEGVYGALMDETGCEVLVKRPDFNLFGGCATVADLPALLNGLRSALRAVKA
jgi:2-polyprenyl-6-methoxyphenol hydroxylase-like FAD-dependent oxidoreductase